MTEFLVTSAQESRLFHVEHYDVIVIGAGHAGIEAANISEKYGLKTALIYLHY